MKLRKAVIDNFKGIKHLDLDFTTPDRRVRDRTLLLGDNGSGKTTVLQAIALTLGWATRKIGNQGVFRWPGFIWERMSSLGATSVNLRIEFGGQEMGANVEFVLRLTSTPDGRNFSPPNASFVRLREFPGTSEGAASIEFSARRDQLLRLKNGWPEPGFSFAELGSVIWFDQLRSLGASGKVGWAEEVEALRTKLVGLWSFHTSTPPPEKDHIVLLQQHMARIFPGFKFVGVQPRNDKSQPTPTNMYVMVRRDGCEVPYDISEMSSGEQAVFPLAYEIVWQDIANSVVLLDELELHLHPPEQQGLYNFLPKLAPGCQFIVTSHSVALEDIVPEDEKIRLHGGGLCR